MIPYHCVPIGTNLDMGKFFKNRHAMVSVVTKNCLPVCAATSRTFAMDNGAFTAWKNGNPITDWQFYYDWVSLWRNHPGFSWAIIPDVIEGSEEENDLLVEQWPFGLSGVPVWHTHESLERFVRLCTNWPRVAIGSSGPHTVVGTDLWWSRMFESIEAVSDERGLPICKLHGLRMLNQEVFTQIPLASADSSNVARNASRMSKRLGVPLLMGAEVIASRIENSNWEPPEDP